MQPKECRRNAYDDVTVIREGEQWTTWPDTRCGECKCDVFPKPTTWVMNGMRVAGLYLKMWYGAHGMNHPYLHAGTRTNQSQRTRIATMCKAEDL